MADNGNMVDISTGEIIEQVKLDEMDVAVQDAVQSNKFRFNKIWILEAMFHPLKRSEHFSSLIQDLQYTRSSDEASDTKVKEFKKAA